MATSGSFKKTARQARNITVEDFFDKGIYMTDAALTTGLCGNLVNYRIDTNTGHLKPRGGFCPKNPARDVCTVSEVDGIDISFKEYYPIRSDLLINDQDKIHTFSIIASMLDPGQLSGDLITARAPIREQGSISGVPYTFKLKNNFEELPAINTIIRYKKFFYKVVAVADVEEDNETVSYLYLNKAFVYEECATADGGTTSRMTAADQVFLLDDEQTLSLKHIIYKAFPTVLEITTQPTYDPGEIEGVAYSFVTINEILQPHVGDIVQWDNYFYTIVAFEERADLMYSFLESITPTLAPDILYTTGLTDGVHIIKDLPAFGVLPEQLGCTLLNTFIGIGSEGLYKYNVVEDIPTDNIMLEHINPMVPDAAFAVQYGYNMLCDDPYVFTNDGTGGAVEFQGLVPYKYRPQASSPFGDARFPLTVETNYKQGEAVLFQLYYKYDDSAAPTAADFKFEIRIGDADEWKPITGGNVKYAPNEGALQHIGVLIQIPAERFQIRVFYKENDPTQCFNIYSFSGGAEEDGATKIDTPNYDLKTAQGIFSWKRRVGLYGVKGAPNLIFLSDIDNPTYFPYPNNIIEYDSPVLKVVNFLDDIMVFTTDGIYQTELGTDGNSYITKQTVGNIHLTMSDMYSIQTIKNMLFYKAGNRYYMLVPSTKYTTLNQLQVAPISAPINYLLDNFEIEFRKILHAMYGSWENAKMEDGNISYLDTFVTTDTTRCELIPTVYSSFVDGDVVKLNYGFRLNGPAIHDVHIIYTLMYDTLHKVWLSDIVELGTLEVLNMYRKSILGTSQYILTNVMQMSNEDETIENTPELTVAILQEDVNTLKDYSINSFVKHFPVRQFLDTGFRDINSAWKKRFREIQIKLTANSRHYTLPENVLVQQTEAYKALYLNPKFKIDNDLRNDGDIYYLSRDEETSTYFLSAKEFYLVAKGDAHLEHELDIDYYPGAEQDLFFKLDEESLTDATTNIVRFKVTGKGRCPRIQLNVHTEVPYELHNVAWVFRNMNAR